MRTSRPVRLFVGTFNVLAAVAVAAYGSVIPFAPAHLAVYHRSVAWGGAGAALLALIAVAFDLSFLGWMAIGYLLWAALLAGSAFAIVLLALALSLSPIVPRPGGSLLQGLVVAVGTAAAIVLLRRYVL